MFKIILGLTFLTQAAFAGQETTYNEIKAPSAKPVVSLFSAYKELSLIKPNPGQGPTLPEAFKYSLGHKASLRSLISGYVWGNYTSWDTPDDVKVDKVKPGKSATTYRRAAQRALSGISTKEQRALADSFVASAAKLRTHGSLHLYTLEHGNSFGACRGLVVIDTYFQEFSLFQSCYSE